MDIINSSMGNSFDNNGEGISFLYLGTSSSFKSCLVWKALFQRRWKSDFIIALHNTTEGYMQKHIMNYGAST